jgi:hypothetical protein
MYQKNYAMLLIGTKCHLWNSETISPIATGSESTWQSDEAERRRRLATYLPLKTERDGQSHQWRHTLVHFRRPALNCKLDLCRYKTSAVAVENWRRKIFIAFDRD